MNKALVLNAVDIQKLLKDHFGEEDYSKNEEIVFARELISYSEWECLEELLQPLSAQPEHNQVLFAIYRQAYIEKWKMCDGNFSKLHEVLKKLLSLDCASTHLLPVVTPDDCSQDAIEESRQALFHKVATYMYKYMYSLHRKAPPNTYPSRLTGLIARGLLYEQCEEAFLNSMKLDTPTNGCVLDLSECFSNHPSGDQVPPYLKIEVAPSSSHNKVHHTSLLVSPYKEDASFLSRSAPGKILQVKFMTAGQACTPPHKTTPSSNELPHTSTPKSPLTRRKCFPVDGTTFTPISKERAKPHLHSVLPVTPPTATLISTLPEKQAIRSVAFSLDGHQLAIGPNSKTLRIFDTREVFTSKDKLLPELYSQKDYHMGSIYCLAWNKDSDLLASGSNDRTINLLYRRARSSYYEPCGTIGNLGGIVRELEFRRESLIGVGGDGLWTMSPERLTRTYHSCLETHMFCVCSIDDNVLATGDTEGKLIVWDTRQRSPVHIHTPSAEYSSITSVDFNKSQLSYSTNTGHCYSLSYTTLGKEEPLSQWSPHGMGDECRSLRYSPNGDWILTGSYNGSVCLTNSTTMEHTKICEHQNKVIQARWYPEKHTDFIIATSSVDRTVCLWKVKC